MRYRQLDRDEPDPGHRLHHDRRRSRIVYHRCDGSDMSGSASGWWIQRLTSLVAVPLCLWLLWAGVKLTGADYQAAMAFMGQPGNAVMAMMLAAVGLFHAQMGIQTIVEDYIPGKAFPAFLIWFTRIGCTVGVVVVIYSASKIAFGA